MRRTFRLNQTLEDHKMEMLTKVSMSAIRRVALFFTTAAVLVLVVGCAGDSSFDRHNKSRLWLTQDGKELYFDATVSQAYPDQDKVAEAARMSWLQDWLKLRKYCGEGYNVTERRKIRDDEYNPQRHDLRYRIECR